MNLENQQLGGRILRELDDAINREHFERAEFLLVELKDYPELEQEYQNRKEKLAVFRIPEAPRPPFVYGEDQEAQQAIEGYGKRQLVKLGFGLLMFLSIQISMWLNPRGERDGSSIVLTLVAMVLILLSLALGFRFLRRKFRF